MSTQAADVVGLVAGKDGEQLLIKTSESILDRTIQMISEKSENIMGKALGLKWKSIGSTKPTNGEELTNSELASALESKTTFTQDEFDAFGITDLDSNVFIESGASYFQPDENVHSKFEELINDALKQKLSQTVEEAKIIAENELSNLVKQVPSSEKITSLSDSSGPHVQKLIKAIDSAEARMQGGLFKLEFMLEWCSGHAASFLACLTRIQAIATKLPSTSDLIGKFVSQLETLVAGTSEICMKGQSILHKANRMIEEFIANTRKTVLDALRTGKSMVPLPLMVDKKDLSTWIEDQVNEMLEMANKFFGGLQQEVDKRLKEIKNEIIEKLGSLQKAASGMKEALWEAAGEDANKAREFLISFAKVTVDISDSFTRTESDVMESITVIENSCQLVSVEVNTKVEALQKVCK